MDLDVTFDESFHSAIDKHGSPTGSLVSSV